MGLRGPAPKVQIRSEELTNLDPPKWLGKIAADHWRKHAGQLKDNQLLTVQTEDAFAVHCDLWERLQSFVGVPTNKSYLDTRKAYEMSAKLFRMVPNEKPQVKEDRYKDFGEVNIE